MRPLVLAVGLSLLAATLAADTADLQAGISRAPAPVALGKQVALPFFIRNNGPNPATNVRVVFTVPPGVTKFQSFSPWGGCDGITCTLPYLSPDLTAEVNVSANVPLAPGPIVIGMAVTSATPDPQPADNAIAVNVDVVDQPDLILERTFLRDAPPESISVLDLKVGNGGAPAANAVLTIELPDGARFLGAVGDQGPFVCDFQGRTATCRAPSLVRATVHLRFVNPPLTAGGYVTANVTVTSDAADLNPRNNTTTVEWLVLRLFAVTNADDSGPGSLRQAILDANADCPIRCVVGFRLPGPLPDAGFFTIRPRAPLPPATFWGAIDGTTEGDLLGVEWTRPLVFIDGSNQPSRDGLTIGSGKPDVTGIAIGNVPGYGIFIEERQAPDFTKSQTRVDRAYVGVDPAGAAAPNLRGIVHVASWNLSVTSSVVSGNRASGIVVANGFGEIRDSRIGVAPASDAPLPNGASGIYLAGKSGALVQGNVLAYNHDFGVGLDAFRRSVQITRNSIHDNGGGIDWGLDGPTPNAADDSRRQPNYPTIESATYDEAKNQSVITLRVDTLPAAPILPEIDETITGTQVEIYANSTANAQAERFVASVHRGAGAFRVTVEGDVRGQWLTATTIRSRIDCYFDNCATIHETSEISPPFPVP